MTSWQKTLLIVSCLAAVLACKMSSICGANANASAAVDHLSFVIVSAIFGGEIPGLSKKPDNNVKA